MNKTLLGTLCVDCGDKNPSSLVVVCSQLCAPLPLLSFVISEIGIRGKKNIQPFANYFERRDEADAQQVA